MDMSKRLFSGKYRPIIELHWPALGIAIFQLAAVIVVDYLTGKDVSFTLLYLLPISTAAWFVGRNAGLVFCGLAAVAGLAMELVEEPLLAKEFWNTGIRLGLYLTFSMLLSYAKDHCFGEGVLRRTHRWVGIGMAAACLLALAAGILQRQGATSAIAGSAANRLARQKGPLVELAELVDECVRTSRPVLLGSRDPRGPSCVTVSRTGDVRDDPPATNADLNGGPGTTMGLLLTYGRESVKSPQQDFVWHQTRLKNYLENEAAMNGPPAELSRHLADKTQQLWETAKAWNSLPAGLKAAGFSRRDDWPSFCLSSLDEAIGRGNLAGVKHWSGELAAAAFSLDDLHRWLTFLVKNQLTALEFQNRCQSLFAAAEALHQPYLPGMTVSRFPAAVLGMNGMGNYFEVERQAERLFSMPPDRLAEIAADQHLTDASLWVPPGVRESFLKLQSVLSPENQKVWQQAARAPFHHSYLVNMLYRAAAADADDELCSVLKNSTRSIRTPKSGRFWAY